MARSETIYYLKNHYASSVWRVDWVRKSPEVGAEKFLYSSYELHPQPQPPTIQRPALTHGRGKAKKHEWICLSHPCKKKTSPCEVAYEDSYHSARLWDSLCHLSLKLKVSSSSSSYVLGLRLSLQILLLTLCSVSLSGCYPVPLVKFLSLPTGTWFGCKLVVWLTRFLDSSFQCCPGMMLSDLS